MARSTQGANLQLTPVTPITAIIAALMVALGSYGVVTDLTGASGGERPTWSSVGSDDGAAAAGVLVGDRPGGADAKAIEALHEAILAHYRTR
ncbi:hypothetical protein [Janibacter sp. DB-40]|uniref:hypothetical protein n=1 Tax=Janibacter sp. DB-40 TaxID=3028808 RepID=UPI002405B121|nr:hypothetical protein [Janibacter sp. DB-40]